MAIAWISFPVLSPNIFWKKVIFFLVAAMGKPPQVDMATLSKTRPSCARAKVKVDLKGEFSTRINMGVRKRNGEMVEKQVNIKYNYVPKYCNTCKLQVHSENKYFILHPEL